MAGACLLFCSVRVLLFGEMLNCVVELLPLVPGILRFGTMTLYWDDPELLPGPILYLFVVPVRPVEY